MEGVEGTVVICVSECVRACAYVSETACVCSCTSLCALMRNDLSLFNTELSLFGADVELEHDVAVSRREECATLSSSTTLHFELFSVKSDS